MTVDLEATFPLDSPHLIFNALFEATESLHDVLKAVERGHFSVANAGELSEAQTHIAEARRLIWLETQFAHPRNIPGLDKFR